MILTFGFSLSEIKPSQAEEMCRKTKRHLLDIYQMMTNNGICHDWY